MDRPVNQRIQPEKSREMWRRLRDLSQPDMIGEKHTTSRQGDNAMVHGFEQESVKVDEIARHLKRRELSAAILQHFVARCQSFDQQGAVGRTGSGSHQILADGEITSG
jgi:hypothetical protein